MSKIIDLKLVREQRALSLEEAWQRFVDAKLKSEQTLALDDGVAAHNAYLSFLYLCAERGVA